MTRFLFPNLLFILAFQLHGQDPATFDLVKEENRLRLLFDDLYTKPDSLSEQLIEEINVLMPRVLAFEGAMEYPWDKLDRIGVITSEDGQIRIFTWHVTDDQDHYRYFGYIQVAQKREKISVVPLRDNFLPQRNLSRLEQSVENWYGKLYYGMVTRSVKRKTYYTLLGMDFNNSTSRIKTVEVIAIQRNRPLFLRELFTIGKDRVDRLILEYSSQVAITLRYDPDLDLIAFDHLVPFHPVYHNNFEFYGPDGSFDGLEFSDGAWNLKEDIDARLQY